MNMNLFLNQWNIKKQKWTKEKGVKSELQVRKEGRERERENMPQQ